ncbi:hypothetical protein JHK87_019472 [Glycine soja]|nr:hypothetical protein JHK87_019472 [Glycine soja]
MGLLILGPQYAFDLRNLVLLIKSIRGPQPISTLWRRQNHHQPSTINLLLPRLSSSIVVDHFSSSFVLHRLSSASIVDRSKTRFKRCDHQGHNTNGCCYPGVSRRPPNWIPPPPDEDVTPLMVSCPMPSSQLVMMTFMPTPRLPQADMVRIKVEEI